MRIEPFTADQTRIIEHMAKVKNTPPPTIPTREIVDLAMREGAAQKPAELARFIDFIQQGPPPRVVLEIGTMLGGTLAAWCQLAADDALIISIDLPGGRWGGENLTEDRVNVMRGFARADQEIKFYRCDSHDPRTLSVVAPWVATRCGIDLLFIDGDHTLEGARQDFETYTPLVKPGGLVALHDILPHPQVPDCDVDQLWEQLKLEHQEWFEFTEPSDHHPVFGQWGGIGALEWAPS